MAQTAARAPRRAGNHQPHITRWLTRAAGYYRQSQAAALTSQEVARLRQKTEQLALKVLDLDERNADAFNLLGRLALDRQQLADARELIQAALHCEPNNPGIWYSQGHVQLAAGRLADAERAFAQALQRDPDNFRTRSALALTQMQRGDVVSAFQRYRELIRENPRDPHARTQLFACLRRLRADYDNPELAADLDAFLDLEDINPGDLAGILASLFRHRYHLDRDDAVVDLVDVANDGLLLKMLRRMHVTDVHLEQFLIALRARLFADSAEALTDSLLPLACALAIHHHHAEYVHPISAEEQAALAGLREQLADALRASAPEPEQLLPLLLRYSWYLPPSQLPRSARLERIPLANWPVAAQGFIQQTVLQPLQNLREPPVAHLGEIADPVSRAVRAQYEQHPYPRWLALDYHSPTEYRDALSRELVDFQPPLFLQHHPIHVLIAGCGTGRHALNVARYFRNTQVMAVDLSQTSLRYARHMATRYGIDNIDFLQADILDLVNLDQRFHIIEASGVLHHMAEPLLGAQVLRNLLLPQGLMKLGLYSQRARHEVNRCRADIARRQLTPTADQLRDYRQWVIQRYLDHGELSTLVQSSDFYTASGCRDLLFHVQEHQYTPLDLADWADNLAMQFLGFVGLSAQTRAHYRQAHPEDRRLTNLACWDAFEAEHPRLFGNMFQFYLQRD